MGKTRFYRIFFRCIKCPRAGQSSFVPSAFCELSLGNMIGAHAATSRDGDVTLRERNPANYPFLDDTFLAQRGDGGRSVAEICQYETGVLAECRRSRDDFAGGLRQLDRCARDWCRIR
jgi:hypothetical protein